MIAALESGPAAWAGRGLGGLRLGRAAGGVAAIPAPAANRGRGLGVAAIPAPVATGSPGNLA